MTILAMFRVTGPNATVFPSSAWPMAAPFIERPRKKPRSDMARAFEEPQVCAAGSWGLACGTCESPASAASWPGRQCSTSCAS
jgi:hypothetical protein